MIGHWTAWTGCCSGWTAPSPGGDIVVSPPAIRSPPLHAVKAVTTAMVRTMEEIRSVVLFIAVPVAGSQTGGAHRWENGRRKAPPQADISWLKKPHRLKRLSVVPSD